MLRAGFFVDASFYLVRQRFLRIAQEIFTPKAGCGKAGTGPEAIHAKDFVYLVQA